MKKNPNGPGASAPWLAARIQNMFISHVKNFLEAAKVENPLQIWHFWKV